MPLGAKGRGDWALGIAGLPGTELIHYWRDDRSGAPSHDTRPGTEQPSPEEEDGGYGSEPKAQPI
jgi:hypothetical protein